MLMFQLNGVLMSDLKVDKSNPQLTSLPHSVCKAGTFLVVINLEISLSSSLLDLNLYHTKPKFNNPKKEMIEKNFGLRRNVGYQLFLLFSQCFLPFPKQISMSKLHFGMC